MPLVGLAPQDIGVYPALTVDQNLRFFGELTGLRSGAARRRAGELAVDLRLRELMARPAGRLSGGEQRRLHTAIALVHRPRVVLLDEPTAGADLETRGAILDVVRRIASDGAAVLYTSHYLPEIEELGAGVSLLTNGRIVARGSIAELVAAHAPARLELSFRDSVDPDAVRFASARSADAHAIGNRLVVDTADPAAALAPTLAWLGSLAEQPADVTMVRPTLEAAYRAVLGTDPADGPAAEPAAPAEPVDPAAPAESVGAGR